MKAYEQRVIEEKNELDGRLAKLLTFIGEGAGLTFSGLIIEERQRLTTQARIMREYSDVLADRITAF